MSPKKMGRPTDSPKTIRTTVRMDECTIKKLEHVAKVKGVSKSDVVRTGIEIQYNETKKE